MITIDIYKGKNIALFGLGLSGLATAKALIDGGANLYCWDDNEQSRLRAAECGIPLLHLSEVNWSNISSLVLSPGVSLHFPSPHWTVELAKNNNVEVIGDIELFVRQRNYFLETNKMVSKDMPFIAITGTNGKSTTTSLIAFLLKSIGVDVEIGGNIGQPILDLASFKFGRCYVIECSSFQIDLTPNINPDVGILLNITPDHIDRHGTLENYIESKLSLVRGAKIKFLPDDMDIPGIEAVKVAEDKILSQGYYSQGKKLYFATDNTVKELADLSNSISLRGKHNIQNALNAIGALDQLFGDRVKNFSWQPACLDFESLPHRMQQIRKIGNISFVNDSKATNAEASMQALSTFENIYWIIGGIAKYGGIDSLKPLFNRVTKAYLIGEAADGFGASIGNHFSYVNCGTLERAVALSYEDAKKDPKECTILLSPACASYDQFANYSARGDAFIKFVKNL